MISESVLEVENWLWTKIFISQKTEKKLNKMKNSGVGGGGKLALKDYFVSAQK